MTPAHSAKGAKRAVGTQYCVLPSAVQKLVDTRFTRGRRTWAMDELAGTGFAGLSLSLRPPTGEWAFDHLDAVDTWIRAWQAFDDKWSRSVRRTLPDGPQPGASVVWTERRWSSLGTQRIPTHVEFASIESMARVLGRTEEWARLTARTRTVFDWWTATAEWEGGGTGAEPSSTEHTLAQVRAVVPAIEDLSDEDFELLMKVVQWLADHPDSGRYMRELPIRGVDSKWVERRRRLVERMVLGATGRARLGLRAVEPTVRLRFLDPAARILPGVSDLALVESEAAALDLEPRGVLVVENLQTFLALPADGSLPVSVAVWGNGYSASVVAKLPWIRNADVLYWGDLDSHGFGILNRFRTHCASVRSVLMDEDTLGTFAELWVREPKPLGVDPAHLERLTEPERAVLRRLRAEGHVRLEQERIAWPYALGVLAGSAAHASAG